MARTSTGADKLEELGWECVRHKGSDMWPVQHDIQPFFWDSDPSEEDEDSGVDDTDLAMLDQLNSEPPERFGGVYLGYDFPEDELDAGGALKVRYIVHKYGAEEKGKGKKGKEEFDDIDTMLHGNKWPEEPQANKSNMKMKHFDVNHQGVVHEKPVEGMISALERVNTCTHDTYNYMSDASGIYFGDCESQISVTENRPPRFEDCMPFISGKIADLPPPPPEEVKVRSTGKEIFDEADIYLGDDSLDDVPDDSIEANMSSILPSPPPPYYMHDNRTYPIENNEPLKPISEEKLQENIDIKNNDLIGLSVVKEITVEVMKENESSQEKLVQNENSTLQNENSTLDMLNGSEDNSFSSTLTIVSGNDNERFRSISFTDGAGCRSETIPRSPRSFSFSGAPLHTKVDVRTPNHPRSDSDPGVITNLLASSVSSLGSDHLRNGPDASVANGKKLGKAGNRTKSRSENEGNASDSDRSSSIVSDNSSQGVTRNKSTSKQLRNGSTLSTSPKSSQHFPSMSDCSRGYSAWQTLRKQRSFRKEMDSPERRLNKTLGYRRRIDVRNGNTLTGRTRCTPGFSTSGTGELITNDTVQHCATSEVYVGRCLPGSLSDFFQIEPYVYAGSWADNFNDPSEILESLNNNYHHAKDRCLACGSDGSGHDGMKKGLVTNGHDTNNTNNDNHVDVINEESESSHHSTYPVAKMDIFREVLTLVCNLSGAMGSKNIQQEVFALRGRYPWAFQDLCLYSQVMEILGMFSYRLPIRRFIQFLFEGVDFSHIFETADGILGRTSLNAS